MQAVREWFRTAYPRRDAPLLAGHRPRSIRLNTAQRVEIRARQRTYEAAYWRTTLGQLSFSVIILSIFQSIFYPIGVAYCIYALAMVGISIYRRSLSNKQFFADGFGRWFGTAGRVVIVTTGMSLGLYIALLILLLKIPGPLQETTS